MFCITFAHTSAIIPALNPFSREMWMHKTCRCIRTCNFGWAVEPKCHTCSSWSALYSLDVSVRTGSRERYATCNTRAFLFVRFIRNNYFQPAHKITRHKVVQIRSQARFDLSLMKLIGKEQLKCAEIEHHLTCKICWYKTFWKFTSLLSAICFGTMDVCQLSVMDRSHDFFKSFSQCVSHKP